MANDLFGEDFRDELTDVNVELGRIRDLADGVASSVSRAFRGAVMDGKSFRSVLSDIAGAFAEMSFRNGIGCNVTIPGKLRADRLLFSESGGFVIEVAPDNLESVMGIFLSRDVEMTKIGETTAEAIMKINNVVNLSVAAGKDAWENGLRKKLG